MEDVQKPIRIGNHTVCHICIFYCVIKHLDKSNIRKNSLFCSQFQGSVHHCTEGWGIRSWRSQSYYLPRRDERGGESHINMLSLHSELRRQQSVDVPTRVNIIFDNFPCT